MTSQAPTPNAAPKGPSAYRWGIYGFSVLFTFLLIQLLQFLLSDIGRREGPDREAVFERIVDQALLEERESLVEQREEIDSRIEGRKEVQQVLRDGAENSQQTMNQLLAIHERNLKKDVRPTAEEQQALAESQTRFLANQKLFQEANAEIADLNDRRRKIEERLKAGGKEVAEQEKPAREEYDRLLEKHRLLTATLQLSLLVPLFFLTAYGVWRKRGTTFAPLYYAGFAAAFWETGRVVHRYFPSEYFKYIALLSAIAVVVAFLVHLLRNLARPNRKWLAKRNREAYRKRVCPVCEYPIEGARAVVLSKKARNPLGPESPKAPVVDAPYTCPSCGERLFEKCGSCGSVRHSLLPSCLHCGSERAPAESPRHT